MIKKLKLSCSIISFTWKRNLNSGPIGVFFPYFYFEVWESKRKLSIQGPEEEDTNSPKKLFKPLNQQTRLAANSQLLSPECLQVRITLVTTLPYEGKRERAHEDEDSKTNIVWQIVSNTVCCWIQPWNVAGAKIYGRPFVSKLWHDVRAVFSHVYLRSFLLCGVFIPEYTFIFLQTRIYMRTKKGHIYGLQTNMCIWGHGRSTYKRHQNCTIGNKPLHVWWSWEVTSVWIKHGRIDFK